MDNRRFASLWHYEALGRAQELTALLDFFTASRTASADPDPAWQSLAAAVATDLGEARKAAALRRAVALAGSGTGSAGGWCSPRRRA